VGRIAQRFSSGLSCKYFGVALSDSLADSPQCHGDNYTHCPDRGCLYKLQWRRGHCDQRKKHGASCLNGPVLSSSIWAILQSVFLYFQNSLVVCQDKNIVIRVLLQLLMREGDGNGRKGENGELSDKRKYS